jgi:phenylalanyl-tRNA synthetase alpha subunit
MRSLVSKTSKAYSNFLQGCCLKNNNLNNAKLKKYNHNAIGSTSTAQKSFHVLCSSSINVHSSSPVSNATFGSSKNNSCTKLFSNEELVTSQGVSTATSTITRSNSTSNSGSTSTILKDFDLSHPECNIPESIASRVGTNLHLQQNHPLNTIKTKIEDYWQQRSSNNAEFVTRDNFKPVVPIDDNFDSLLIPTDHVSRSKSDTYYINKQTVLRTHTSAHQTALLKEGVDRFLVTGDVYRLVLVGR